MGDIAGQLKVKVINSGTWAAYVPMCGQWREVPNGIVPTEWGDISLPSGTPIPPYEIYVYEVVFWEDPWGSQCSYGLFRTKAGAYKAMRKGKILVYNTWREEKLREGRRKWVEGGDTKCYPDGFWLISKRLIQ